MRKGSKEGRGDTIVGRERKHHRKHFLSHFESRLKHIFLYFIQETCFYAVYIHEHTATKEKKGFFLKGILE